MRVQAVLKRELGAWAGDVAEDLGVQARWSMAVRRADVCAGGLFASQFENP